MLKAKVSFDELSFRRIVGFACNQSFVFFVLYMDLLDEAASGTAAFGRPETLAVLCAMAVGLVLLSRVSAAFAAKFLARPVLVLDALLMAAASLCPDSAPLAVRVASALVLGACSSFLLAAWGRSFGALEPERFAMEVMAGSLAAAAVCLLFSFASMPQAMLLARVFPVASAAWMDNPAPAGAGFRPAAEGASDADVLSWKAMCGMFAFGASCGVFCAIEPARASGILSGGRLAMFLLAAFLVGALSIMLSDGFGKGGTLNKSYRLAVFMLVSGAMLASVPGFQAALPAASAVLAGFLGLEAVLVCLFLAVSRIRRIDGLRAFSNGFACLFAGQVAGILVYRLCCSAAFQAAGIAPAAAGIAALAAYIFLFTERDFDSLSKIIEKDGSFEAACESIAGEYGLSKREAEILPLALSGRTGARIAQELGISKSTVDTHLRHIYAKCGVSGRQGLIDLKEER